MHQLAQCNQRTLATERETRQVGVSSQTTLSDLLEALSWSMFLSWSRSRETGWSTTVKVLPSFSSWSSSWFCCSLSVFCSGPRAFCTGQQHTVVKKRPVKVSIKLFCSFQSEAPSCSALSLWSAGIRQTGTGTRPPALRSLVTKCRQVAWDVAQIIKVLSPHFGKMLGLLSPVSTSLPSCSRLRWEMRFSSVTAFRRCFRFWKRGCQSGTKKTGHLLTPKPDCSTFDLADAEVKEHHAFKSEMRILFPGIYIHIPQIFALVSMLHIYMHIYKHTYSRYIHTTHKHSSVQTLHTHKHKRRPQGRRHVCLSPRRAATPERPSAASPSGSCPAISPSPLNHLRAQAQFNEGQHKAAVQSSESLSRQQIRARRAVIDR